MAEWEQRSWYPVPATGYPPVKMGFSMYLPASLIRPYLQKPKTELKGGKYDDSDFAHWNP